MEVQTAPADIPAASLMPARLKRRTLEILEVATPGDILSRIFDVALLSLIVLNVVAMVLESISSIGLAYAGAFRGFEVFSVVVFTAEYALRLWSCAADPRFAKRGGRARFASQPMSVIDLLAVLPFWLPFVGVDLRVLRTLRLFRIFHIAKLGRYSVAMQLLGTVAYARRAELAVTGAMGAVLLLLASTLMYFAEGAAQPGVFSSIPASMWWAITTLTTVGYGDVVPVTATGHVLAAVIAVTGIGMFALPTGILGAAFTEEIQARRSQEAGRCPHCGR
jgi:voltage-gated potassium channel